MGCRVANIFRIYIILVSLMWNGVEAVHMYMTLVKVFTAHASYFVLKAGLVAWGIPLFVVLIAAAVNIEIYDGVLINCTFSCRLSTVAFYGLFLTPMLIIVLFNSIVFGLVLRVIRKIYKTGNL
ncbi:adhesion G-protein coupled receptor G2-like [Strongylocentrotus purpuratus]|uniref:G-protein coupled receptors family 2 profile 2 domain-containing protein n=1 Tax=Strongylocentrotus purpuratus TaxID=7668 RepID=A0A7M7HF11_STRPU|nr:adhesion G-protein coupled receptor G2-like [Strongylocentrotus purpuratus]